MNEVRLAVVIALAGCNAILGVHGETVGSGGGSDDAHAPGDIGGDGSLCFGSLVTHCFTGRETSLVLPSVFDTSNDARCDPMTTAVCVVAGDQVGIGNGTRVTGSRPLAIFALSDFSIGGETLLDVGSHTNDAGPAANDQTCANTDATNDAPGTAGGSFSGAGGAGGSVGGMMNPGAGPTILTADHLRGGCPGGKPITAQSRAASGGAVYVFARQTIVIQGAIDAGGAGGAAGPSQRGGGGGGAGGMIALEAPSIQLSAGTLQALGGGGGGGGDPNGSGIAGQDGASGGNGGPGSGTGGQGGNATSSNGLAGQPSNFGGGGGAGGAGFILVRGNVASMGTINPPATPF